MAGHYSRGVRVSTDAQPPSLLHAMTDFAETVPYIFEAHSGNTADADTLHTDFAPTQAQPISWPLHIRFTGSGSEYFGIWIVNLLLMLVTLGLYYPWAKVRRLRYFYGNTLVDGSALDFHGSPKRMLRGTLLVVLLLVLYSVAGNFSPVAGLVAIVAVAAIAPALVRAAMRFRLSHTSWRGLRFRFTGSMGAVYAAVLPLYAPIVLIVALGAAGAVLAPQTDGKPPLWVGAAVGLLGLATVAIQPFTLWLLKRYQHQHYALASAHTGFTARPGAFYLLALKTSVVAALVMSAGGTLIGLAALAGFVAKNRPGAGAGLAALIALGALAFAITVLALLVMVKPYVVSRLQNLVWNHTRSDTVQFHSALRYGPLLRLTVKNWLLMLVTLGLYWPFARIALTRMRVEAVSVTSLVDPDVLATQGGQAINDAAGDAAGDLFGFDLGL